MPAALATARSWSARSLAPGAIPTTPTAITEHPAKLHEPSKNETPTQLACPLRSRYVWTGGSPSPRDPAPAGARPTAGRSGVLAGPSEPSRQPQRSYSSFEAYVVDGEVLDGETGWTSPSTGHNHHHHHHHQRRTSPACRAGGTAAGSSGGGSGVGSSDHTDGSTGSGNGSALRPGGRSNFFFGADYSTLAGTTHHAERAQKAAARLPPGPVEPKAAALLGVAGSAGSVPSKAQRLLGVGKREGEEGLVEVLALQDAESPDLSSGAGSTSPLAEEEPPGLQPLGVDEAEEDTTALGADSISSSARAMALPLVDSDDVQVAFPPDFDDGRSSSSKSGGSGSGSAGGGSAGSSSDDGGKAQSSDSLGTKSGSTSLLSMMSGSPRSLGTAHGSVAESPSPRTPLSDHSSPDGGAAAEAGARSGRGGGGNVVGAGGASSDVAVSASEEEAAAARIRNLTHEPWSSSGAEADRPRQTVAQAAAVAVRRAGSTSLRHSQQQKDLPAVSVTLAGTGRGGEVGDNEETDLPSAHPTPLSTFAANTDLPPDHPTPLSSLGSTRRGTAGVDAEKPANSTSNTFMQRLKYWGGGGGSSSGGEKASDSSRSKAQAAVVVPAVPAAAVETVTAMTPARVTSSASSSSSPKVDQGRSSLSTVEQSSPDSSTGGGSCGSVASGDGIESPEYAPGGISPSELRGVKVVPYDSVTSDSMSAFASSASDQLFRATGPPRTTVSRGGGGGGGEGGQQQQQSRMAMTSPSYFDRNGDGLSAQAPLMSSTTTTRDGGSGAGSKETDVFVVPSTSSETFAATAAIDTASGSGSGAHNFSGFGVSHRAELAALRLARGTPVPGDKQASVGAQQQEDEVEEGEDSDVDAEMDLGWGSGDEEEEIEVKEKTVGRSVDIVGRVAKSSEGSEMDVDSASSPDEEQEDDDDEDQEDVEEQHQVAALTMAEKLANMATPHARGLGVGPAPKYNHNASFLANPLHQQSPPSPPRYMAIVEAANVTSALDHSSTSEVDTSPSEDDGGMMAEILTDRLMEVCSKMEAVAAPPADELSDGEGGIKRRSSVRRQRQLSNMSSRTLNKDQGTASTRRHGRSNSFFSTSGMGDVDDGDADSDEGTIRDDGVAARKLRRERQRKRSRGLSRRNLASALVAPTDKKGEPIGLHTAAYNGHMESLASYISQHGDLEARDQFQATALMLCSERGHTEMVDALLSAGADTCGVDENGNSALHLACFYGNREVVEILLSVEDVDVGAVDSEGRTPLDLATDPSIRRMVRTEELVRLSGETFDLLGAVEVNDVNALGSFISMGQEACGYPHNSRAVSISANRLRLDRPGRDGMTAVHLSAFHGYSDSLRLLLEAGADPNAVCDDGETPLHTACTGGSIVCATLLLDHGANPLATDAKGLVPCEKHIAGGRQELKRLLESKAFQATPSNLMALRADLAEVALQIDAEEDLFVRKGVAIKYLRKALKKKEADTARLRQAVDARDTDIRNLGDRMDSVHRVLMGIAVQ